MVAPSANDIRKYPPLCPAEDSPEDILPQYLWSNMARTTNYTRGRVYIIARTVHVRVS